MKLILLPIALISPFVVLAQMVITGCLYHGKMGLKLRFVHYFRHSGLMVFDDTANELIDELTAKIQTEMPVGFTSGLSGVGWGILRIF